MPFKITAQHRDSNWEITGNAHGISLLDQLQSAGVPIKSSCMGKGVCRQCRVQVLKGLAPINAVDRKTFSEGQLKEGWRLSCGIRPKTAIEVRFPQAFVLQQRVQASRRPMGSSWIVVDLGTTGIEMAAVDQDGVWAKVKATNRQVSMGADVMTRLEYAQRNGVKPLYDRTTQQLREMLALLRKTDGAEMLANKLWVAGNSVVTAFLAQQPIDTLAVAPYQPATTLAQIFCVGDLQFETLPLLSSFVGGDLFAGLFFLYQRGEILKDRSWVLIDVGTNSEILFWDGKKLFVSSTPAGPAFEGSSISIGMTAESGAIIHPLWSGSAWKFEVIDQDVPRGICGSGLVEMVAQAVQHGLVSEDGEVLSAGKLNLTSDLALSQDDIREFQLAKSAIQTGVALIQGESDFQAQKLYLAGAFGENLDLNSSQALGLLPFVQTETLGNSSLKGAVAWSQASSEQKNFFCDWLAAHMVPVELALKDEFQTEFILNMNLKARSLS